MFRLNIWTLLLALFSSLPYHALSGSLSTEPQDFPLRHSFIAPPDQSFRCYIYKTHPTFQFIPCVAAKSRISPVLPLSSHNVTHGMQWQDLIFHILLRVVTNNNINIANPLDHLDEYQFAWKRRTKRPNQHSLCLVVTVAMVKVKHPNLN